MPPSGTVSGTAQSTSDTDWYTLAPSADGAPLRIAAEGDIAALAVHDGVYEQTLFLEPDGATYASGPVTLGVPLSLRVSAVGPYTIRLAGSEPQASAGGAAAGLQADLALKATLSDPTVAAWWPTGQRLAGIVQLTNAGDEDLDVTLEGLASDRGWQLGLSPETVRVPAAGTAEVPVEVVVPADVPGDEPVRLTVRARTAAGGRRPRRSTSRRRERPCPSSRCVRGPSPDSLLGGLDAASLALGAVPITSLDADGENRLHDGFAASDWGLSYPIGGLPVTLTVDLAGNDPVPVAGTILHPLAQDLALGDAVRTFELALSLDGGTWETVLVGLLEPVATEQAFVLPQPMDARYAQLRVTSLQRELPSRIDLGEWKVVASPGWSPPGGNVDLADLGAGGHVSWMSPQADFPHEQGIHPRR